MKIDFLINEWQFWYRIKVCRVTDGDTLVGLMDLGMGHYQHMRIRLAGIDAPESRSSDEVERMAGHKAKGALIERLKKYIPQTMEQTLDFFDTKTTLVLQSDRFEKYGRVLGVLWEPDATDESVNQWLVRCGFAKEW